MGRASKQHGARFEKKVTEVFQRWGWTSNRLRSFRVEGEPDLYATMGGLLLDVQAKERQSLNVHGVLVSLIRAQGVIDAKQGQRDEAWAIPCVVYKHVEKQGDTGRRMQEGPVTITLPLESFLHLVRQANRAGMMITIEELLGQITPEPTDWNEE